MWNESQIKQDSFETNSGWAERLVEQDATRTSCGKSDADAGSAGA